jgi:prepilin signal peptidase PulO-like enzyme (type II secretory pathway)
MLVGGLVYLLTVETIKISLELLLGRKVLGGGDVKLMTISGLLLGVQQIAKFFIFAGIGGLVCGSIQRYCSNTKNKRVFPFAPSLVLALYLLLLQRLN